MEITRIEINIFFFIYIFFKLNMIDKIIIIVI